MAIFPGTMYDDVGEMALIGGSEDDIIWGGRGDDELRGGEGDDRLIGGPGADVLDGGPGNNTAGYAGSRGGVHVDLSASFSGPDDENAPVRGGDAAGDSLTNIQNLWGSMFGDALIGNHEANILLGFRGNDQLTGNEGADYLRGGDGADTIMGDAGNDMVFGDMGVDKVKGGAGNDMVWGGKGDDTVLDGEAGDDTIEGGAGADVITGGDGNDTVAYTRSPEGVTVDLRVAPADATAEQPHAAGGHATGDEIAMDVENIIGSMHDDVLHGRDHETNVIMGLDGNDAIMGWCGADKLMGGPGMDTLYGGNSDDTLMGGMGDDALKGGTGNDILSGGAGADKIFGGTVNPDTMEHTDHGDNDTADYSESDAGVTIDLSNTSRSMPNPIGEGGHAEGDELQGIESLKGSMYDDMLTGTDAPNTLNGMDGDDMLTGKGGDDTIDGGMGDDTINGGAGADMLIGGAGDDTFVYRMVDDAAAATDDPNTGRVAGAPDVPADGSLDLYQIDETRYRVIDLADDQADGDLMVSGGDGMDTVDASGATGAVHINLNVMRLVAAPMDEVAANPGTTPPVAGQDAQPLQEAPIYTSIEMVMGGEGNDTLKGNAAAPTTLVGGEGDDTLEGGSQDDTLEGGAGNDTLDGGSNADYLMGGSGDDSLAGGTGNDTLAGGLGNDTLVGGDGADTYVYTGGQDEITFQVSRAGGDRIDLSALELTASELEDVLAGARTDAGNTYLNVVGDWDAGSGIGGWDIQLTGYLEADDGDLAMSDFIL